MKKSLLCCFMIALVIGGCTQQKSSKIEGAWQLVYNKSIAGDTLLFQFPGNYTGSDMKMWSKDHFVFVGLFKSDTITQNNYGGGTYTLKGNLYAETILFHTYKEVVGKTFKMIIEIKNDTLYQTWPVDDNGKIDSANYNVEKYTRF
jgi:hypothetical protein